MRLSMIAAIVLFVFSLGCATKSMVGPNRIELKGQMGQVDVTRYYSHSYIEDYEGSQKIRQRDEIVDFKVKEEVTQFDPVKDRMTVMTETIFKDGTVDLHDLAFPEKGEQIEFVLSRSGDVFKAGEYPPDSIFFVPPVPLPKETVSVGDTWTLDRAWVGMKNGVPLGVHLVIIFKDLTFCGKERCADLEVSGNVEVIGLKSKKNQFTSKIWGRMLMSLDRGNVLWSEMRSRELMNVPDAHTEVLSCMTATLEGYKLPKNRVGQCRPTLDPFN